MRIPLFYIIALGACAQFPALEGTISETARNAPYPALTQIPANLAVTADTSTTMDVRIAALQARATRLRQIDIAALQ